MDIMVTAEAITTAKAVLAQAQAGGLSPDQLVIGAGVLTSHISAGFADKIPAAVRPLAIALGSAAVTAGAAVTTGTPWQTAVGYGIGAAAIGKLYHLLALKPDSLLAGVLKALTSATPPKA